MTTIVIAGGGTGGHVFPMIAVGDAVKREEPQARVVYVGTARGLEAKIMRERGDELVLLDIRPLRGGGVSGFADGLLHAALSLPRARRLARSLGADVVLSVGGYAGGPVALGARSLGVPVTLLEPNSVMGLSNRLLAPVSVRAYTAFPEVERALRPSVVRREGVPLRRAFDAAAYEAPRAGEPLELLVLGGSQGARALNEAVPEAAALAREAGVSLAITHQAGGAETDKARAAYERLGLSARVVPFIDDVAAALSAAHLVLGRAGASSLAELMAVGRPALLVPYPFAADDHQLVNARSLESAGAAVALPQREASPARLAALLTELAREPERLARMAAASATLGKPHAAREVARDLLSLARAHEARRARARVSRSSGGTPPRPDRALLSPLDAERAPSASLAREVA